MIENEAMSIYHSLLKTYIDPLLKFCDIFIDANGMLIDRQTNGAIRYTNEKYKEGDEDKSPIIFLCVALNEEHFLRIKESPELDLFNPFIVQRHALILAIKFKRALNAFVLSETALELPDEDQDELIQLMQSARDENGDYSMEFINYEDSNNPTVISRYLSVEDDQCKMALGLCGCTYNQFEKKPLKKYVDFEKSWKTIQRKVDKFNVERKKIKTFIKEEINNTADISQMDLSGGKEVDAITIAYETAIYDEDDYVDEDDMEQYLSSLFNGDDLIPVAPDIDSESVEDLVQQEMLENVGEEDVSVIIPDQHIDTTPIEEESISVKNDEDLHDTIDSVPRRGGFRIKQPVQMTSPMQQQPFFYQQQSMQPQSFNMQMNPAFGFQNATLATMDLSGGESPNPFSAYQ